MTHVEKITERFLVANRAARENKTLQLPGKPSFGVEAEFINPENGQSGPVWIKHRSDGSREVLPIRRDSVLFAAMTAACEAKVRAIAKQWANRPQSPLT